MRLTIITPTGIKYEGETSRVQFRSTTGLMEILDNHAPMIAEVKEGSVMTDKETFDCGGGLLKVEKNVVEIVCE